MATKKTAQVDPTVYTLAGFEAVNLKTLREGQRVIFRTLSISHTGELPLYHSRPARVVSISRETNKVTVEFKDQKQFRLDPRNLIPFTEQSFAQAALAYRYVQDVVTEGARTEDGKAFRIRAFMSDWLPKEALMRPAALVAAHTETEPLPF